MEMVVVEDMDQKETTAAGKARTRIMIISLAMTREDLLQTKNIFITHLLRAME
jgi:hypothetical protein